MSNGNINPCRSDEIQYCTGAGQHSRGSLGILLRLLADAESDYRAVGQQVTLPVDEVVALADMGKHYLERALRRLSASRQAQARALGVSERTLFRKLEMLDESAQ